MESVAIRPQNPAANRIRDQVLNQQLVERRDRLQRAITSPLRNDHLQELLEEVDLALSKMEAGTFGICETCHDPVESDRIMADPLCRNCLDHLSSKEKASLERDLDLAYQVQHNLLPQAGKVARCWTLAYHFEPAGPVSGDYCDLIPLNDESSLFFLGDVSGKGVAASMMMTQLHGIFRSLSPNTNQISELVAGANRVFCEKTIYSFFATLAAGKLGADGTVHLCNAGHCYPLHLQRDRITSLKTDGLPLGLFRDGQYSSQALQLSPGDSLVLYSDGLSEAFNSQGNQYGADRLSQLLQKQAYQPASSLLKVILDDVERFRGGKRKTDDLTVMVLHRESA
jgi:sigma-B regulation protein RsbU (phosphoserine phosphatase)